MGKIFLMLALCLFTLTGCAAHNSGSKSYLAPDMPKFSLEDVAEDIAGALVFNYPPGHTTFALTAGNNAFNQALENKLRAKGFKVAAAVNNGAAQDALRLTYTLDLLVEESGCYLTVVLSDGYVYSRVYQVRNGKYIPAPALSGRKPVYGATE